MKSVKAYANTLDEAGHEALMALAKLRKDIKAYATNPYAEYLAQKALEKKGDS